MRVMVLTDGKRVQVSETEESAIIAAISKKDERVIVQAVPYKITFIAYFDDPNAEEMQAAPTFDVFPGARRINAPKHIAGCRAQYSIQREINNIARDQNPKTWAKYIRDTKWRESIRRELWDQSKQWCDDKKGVCACEPEFAPSKQSFNV